MTLVELISIDSMQVYRGMNVGTATSTVEEQARVRHHLIDLVEPSQQFTVGVLQRLAQHAIADVRSRGNLPVLVGGTGLYLQWAVIDDLEIPGQFPMCSPNLTPTPTRRPSTVASRASIQRLRLAWNPRTGGGSSGRSR